MMHETAAFVNDAQLRAVLGETGLARVNAVAEAAATRGLPVWLVGGVVRDALLVRPTDDLDFVVETDDFGRDAAALAHDLAARFGGRVETHTAFGTAKWLPADRGAHLDIVSARRETYAHPAALPTVAPGTLATDLARRDFTLNAMAISLAPHERGRLHDPLGGRADLDAGLLRVHHARSFTDDPTRLLRGARFAARFGFRFADSTLATLADALPAIERTTGERVRGELLALLNEAKPSVGLGLLDRLGVLAAVSPAFTGWQPNADALDHAPGANARLWVLAAGIGTGRVRAWAARLLYPAGQAEAFAAFALLAAEAWHAWPRYRLADALDRFDDAALYALDALAGTAAHARERLRDYRARWRRFAPFTTGAHLRALGLPPGPCYGRLIAAARRAWLDGTVHGEADERILVRQWIARGFCTDEHATDEHATDEHATDEHATDEHATDEHATDEHAAPDRD